MFWDNVAGAYDIFVNVINRKTHQKLNDTYARISELLEEGAQQEHLRRMGNEYC